MPPSLAARKLGGSDQIGAWLSSSTLPTTGTGTRRSSRAARCCVCPKKTPHGSVSTFFIGSSATNSSFLLLHVLLCCFFGAFCPNPEEASVGPGHAQAGEGLEVLLLLGDNAGLLPLENLGGESPAVRPHIRGCRRRRYLRLNAINLATFLPLAPGCC